MKTTVKHVNVDVKGATDVDMSAAMLLVAIARDAGEPITWIWQSDEFTNWKDKSARVLKKCVVSIWNQTVDVPLEFWATMVKNAFPDVDVVTPRGNA